MVLREYIREVKRQFVEVFNFPPTAGGDNDLIMDSVPDGTYDMTIEGRLDHVVVKDGVIDCMNWDDAPKEQPVITKQVADAMDKFIEQPKDYPTMARVYAGQIVLLGATEFKKIPVARHDELLELYRLINEGKPAENAEKMNALNQAHGYLVDLYNTQMGRK